MAATSVSFYTLGCKLNFSETSSIARQFTDGGFEVISFEAGADVYVINTCSVTENADRKCRKIVRQALKANADAFIAIVGCYAQLKPQEIADIEGVDVVLGAAEKFELLERITDFTKRKQALVARGEIGEVNTFIPTFSEEERTRIFLKVQDGCDYKCSFCTIPLARGQSRSAHKEAVLAQAQELVDNGAKEIVISGINLGDYGVGLEYGLLELFELLDSELTDLPRLRVSSIEPNLLHDDIIAFVADSQRFMPHFHVPLQSGNNEILGQMRRRYRRELYADRVTKIRELMPHAAIGVDVIVGFPGETEEQFRDTYTFIADLDVSYLHVFPYSARDNTLAAELPNQLPEHFKHERSKQLRNLSNKKRRAHNARHLDETRSVLFEASSQNGEMFGFTDNYVKVAVPHDPALVNTMQPVTLKRVRSHKLVEASLLTELVNV